MNLNVDSKFNLGDSVYAVEPFYMIHTHSQVLCGIGKNPSSAERPPLQIGTIRAAQYLLSDFCESEIMIEYDLIDRNNPSMRLSHRYKSLSEDDLFTTYEAALDALKARKIEALALGEEE